MKNVITQQMIEKSYEIAKRVHKKQLSKNEGAKNLNEEYGMLKDYAINVDNSNILLDQISFECKQAIEMGERCVK